MLKNPQNIPFIVKFAREEVVPLIKALPAWAWIVWVIFMVGVIFFPPSVAICDFDMIPAGAVAFYLLALISGTVDKVDNARREAELAEKADG